MSKTIHGRRYADFIFGNGSFVKVHLTTSFGGNAMCKYIIVGFLNLLFFVPSLLAYDGIQLHKMSFFEGGYDVPPEVQRQYKTHFPRSISRYIWCQIEVVNLLHRVRDHTHKVVWRYYKPDNSFFGEVSADFAIRKEWDYAWIPHGLGWKDPGLWSQGTYLVEIWIDGKKIGEQRFSIYEDMPVESSTVQLEFQFLKLFESGYTDKPNEQTKYGNSFPKSTTRHVSFNVGAKNLQWKLRNHKPNVVAMYYKEDGTLHGKAIINIDILSEWNECDLWSGWGWSEPGHWSVGKYRIAILFGDKQVAEQWFTIYDDSPQKNPDFQLEKIRFFEGGLHEVPLHERKYATTFSKSQARYIWCQVDVRNLHYQRKLHQHKVTWRYYNPDGSLFGEVKSDFSIKPESLIAWVNHGWGWNQPGYWSVGNYEVQVFINEVLVGKDRFIISGNFPQPEKLERVVGSDTHWVMKNQTPHTIFISYSGPSNGTVTILASQSQTVIVKGGTYIVQGRTSATDILPYIGNIQLIGGWKYENIFYLIKK